MESSCLCLVCPAPDRPAKTQVNGVTVVADEVEQASDLGDGERDQATGPAWPVRWTFRLLRQGWRRQGVWFVHRRRAPFFDLCLITARNAMASIARVMCRYQAW